MVGRRSNGGRSCEVNLDDFLGGLGGSYLQRYGSVCIIRGALLVGHGEIGDVGDVRAVPLLVGDVLKL